MYKTAFNPADTALVVSEDGRTIGGHEWGTVDTTDAVGKRLLADGLLINVDVPEYNSSSNQNAVQAFKHTDEISARAEKARSVDKSVLQETAVQAGLVDADDSVRKNELVDAVAEATDVKLPAKKTSATRRKSQEA